MGRHTKGDTWTSRARTILEAQRLLFPGMKPRKGESERVMRAPSKHRRRTVKTVKQNPPLGGKGREVFAQWYTSTSKFKGDEIASTSRDSVFDLVRKGLRDLRGKAVGGRRTLEIYVSEEEDEDLDPYADDDEYREPYRAWIGFTFRFEGDSSKYLRSGSAGFYPEQPARGATVHAADSYFYGSFEDALVMSIKGASSFPVTVRLHVGSNAVGFARGLGPLRPQPVTVEVDADEEGLKLLRRAISQYKQQTEKRVRLPV